MLVAANMMLTPLLLLAAVAVWRVSRPDAVLFLAGGLLGIGHGLIWQAGAMERVSWLPPEIALMTRPAVVYLFGALFLARSFATPLDGLGRWFYRIVGLIALSPVLVFFVFFPILLSL